MSLQVRFMRWGIRIRLGPDPALYDTVERRFGHIFPIGLPAPTEKFLKETKNNDNPGKMR